MLLAAMQGQAVQKKGRGYVGCSSIGHPCDRFLYHELHASPHSDSYREGDRTDRIFERGHWEETRIKRYFKACKIKILKEQATVGDPQILSGSLDFLVEFEGRIFCVEIKTTNENQWKQIAKKGVEICKPQWWTQLQCYLHYVQKEQPEQKKVQGLFLVVNRNTEEIYEETCFASSQTFEAAFSKAKRIRELQDPPIGLASGGKSRECHFCSYRSQCFPPADPPA